MTTLVDLIAWVVTVTTTILVFPIALWRDYQDNRDAS